MRRRWAPLGEQLVRILSGAAVLVVAATWLTGPWSIVAGLVGAALVVTGLVRLPGEVRYARGVVRVTHRPRHHLPAGVPPRRRPVRQPRYPVYTGPTGTGPLSAPDDAVEATGPGCSGTDATGSGGWSDGGGSSGGGWSDGGGGSSGGGG